MKKASVTIYRDTKPQTVWHKIRPYVVAFLLSTFWLWSFMAAVHWGQHHCVKSAKVKVKK